MHSYPTSSPSLNQAAVASTGNRWTAILKAELLTLPPQTCETRQGAIIAFPNHQHKERCFLLPDLKAGVSAPNI
jgi:hypothetical protein